MNHSRIRYSFAGDLGKRAATTLCHLMLAFALMVSFAVIMVPTSKAGTFVSGRITTDTTWTVEGSPYWVVGSVFVDPNVSLTIEPGVQVLFEGAYDFVVEGFLLADGTVDDRIIFTSDMPSPSPGDWNGILIYFHGSAVIRNTDVLYGWGLSLWNEGNNTVEGSTFSYNKVGVAISYSSSNVLQGNGFYGNDWGGIMINGSVSSNLIKDSIIESSHYYGILISYGGGLDNIIQNNTIRANEWDGMRIVDSQGYEIRCNELSLNGNEGISAYGSVALIHHNNFYANGRNAYEDENLSMWDDGSEGNYWDDYAGNDTDGDGIGDTPYHIEVDSYDYYPLMEPVSYCPSEGGNLPPVAVANPKYQEVDVGQYAWFTGNTSYDPDGYIVSYDWDFGDGTNGSGVATAHSYDSPGNYSVSLTVTDDDGAQDSDWVYVRVGEVPNEPPVADAEPEYQQVYVGEDAWFSGNLSYDPDGFIINYTWEFGDGTYGFGIFVTHGYGTSMNYSVALTVTDNNGSQDSDNVFVSVLPGEELPDLTLGTEDVYFSNDNPNEGEVITIFATIHNVGTADAHNVTVGFWDNADGMLPVMVLIGTDTISYIPYGENRTASVVWNTSGQGGPNIIWVKIDPDNYILELDEYNNEACRDIYVNPTQENQPPIAEAEPDYQTVQVGEEAWFSGNASYDPDGYIVSYEWDFGDGSFGNGSFVTHTYSAPGNYSVKLTVMDDDGAEDTDNCTVSVVSQTPPPFAWIESLSTDKLLYGVGENINTTVVVRRGNDLLDVVWEGIVTLEVYDGSANLVYTDSEPVVIPCGGGNDTAYFEFALSYADNYTIRAILTGMFDVYDVKEVYITVIESNQPPVADAEPDYQVVPLGELAWFSGNLSYDPDGFIVNYTWYFGDGSYGWGVYVEHFYNIPGQYNVTLWVYDNEGLSDFDTVTVLVQDNQTNPVILLTDPVDGEVGVPLNHSISVTFSKQMDPTSLVWVIDPDPGGWDVLWWMGHTVLGLVHSNPFEPSTVYVVEIVEVEDIYGNPLVPGPVPNPWQFMTMGGNLPPVAVALPEVQWVYVGEEAWFDGNLSYDPDGIIVDYSWDFGDGTSGNGIFVLHAYESPGNYSVKLTVTDDGGATDSDWVYVIVEGNVTYPYITYTYPVDGQVGVQLYENITIWFSEPMNSSTVVWTIDPDPGCWNESWWSDDTVLILSHCNPFAENTWHTVHVIYGESKLGHQLVPGPVPNPWSFLTISGDTPPVAIALPEFQQVEVGEVAWFSGNASYDPDGYIVSYDWDFGDGSTAEGAFVTHVYESPENYTVTMTVVDNDGLSDSDSVVVTVLPAEEPGQPILVLSAGLLNIGTFPEGRTRTIPVEVAAFYAPVTNVHIEVIDPAGLEIEVIPEKQDVAAEGSVKFYLEIEVPELEEGKKVEGRTIQIQAFGDQATSNIEYIDLMIREEEANVWWTPETIATGVAAGIATTVGVASYLLRRRL